MKKLSKYLVYLGLMFLVSPVLFSFAMASPFQPHTPQLELGLQSTFFKVAGIYWLPDWQSDARGFSNNTQNDKGGGDTEKIGKCGTYGMVESCGSPKVSTGAVKPVVNLTCQKGCVCPSSYQYTSSNCSGNYILSGGSCDGKYNGCICKAEFKYNASNCSGAYQLSGTACGGNYNACVCKPTVSVGTGEVCTQYCGSNCIAKACKSAVSLTYANDTCTERCASNSSICTAKSCSPACTSSSSAPYGTYTQDNKCGTTCNIAYTDNCRNRTAVTCSYGCQSNWSDCSSKCQTCKTNPDCDVTSQSCTYGCSSTNSCSKCTGCYSDNCRNRTAVSIPGNASCSTFFADCSSKCSAWKCNLYYAQSGNSCVSLTCPCTVGTIFYSDKTCSVEILSGKTAIGVVGYSNATGTSGLIVALDETQKTWSSEYYDLPCIENVSGKNIAQNVGYGKENTACILKTKNSRSATYDAGMYCANYTVGGIGSWFLPSSGEAYRTLYSNADYVNATLGKLGKSKINIAKGWYWSSTEYPSSNGYSAVGAWHLRPSDGYMGSISNGYEKFHTLRVRCIFDF